MKNTNKPEVTQPGELERRRLIKRIDYTIEQAVQSGLITPGELNKLPPSEWEAYLEGLQAIRERLGIPEPVE
jgi:hypothetical protein